MVTYVTSLGVKPGRITPQQSWDATAVAEAYRPKPIPALHEANAPAC